MIKSVSILGSTGSIGVQSLDVARMRGYEVVALTAHGSVDKIEAQIREFRPKFAALADEEKAAQLRIKTADTPTRVLSGREGVIECARAGADAVVNGIVGIAGLEPTLAVIEAGSVLALANKESLVTAGALVMKAAKEKNIPVLPVDSEHSAIFQSIQGCPDRKQIKKLILTASGGPFYGKSREELKNITLEQALAHPNWSMGAKITIDSATMMNKGLELIEAAWLFDMDPDRIEVVVHRQSIVHSLAEFSDNSVIAQLGVPDMRIPIQYALTYPDRFESPAAELDLTQCGALTFTRPDNETFRCIDICRKALSMGGLYPAAVNAANEKANAAFRRGETGFWDIQEEVGRALELNLPRGEYTLEDVLETDRAVREERQV